MCSTINAITLSVSFFSIGHRPNNIVSLLVRMGIWQRLSMTQWTRFYQVSLVCVIMVLILYSLWKSYDNYTMDVWIGGNKLDDDNYMDMVRWIAMVVYSMGARWVVMIRIFLYNCYFDFPSSQPLSHCASMNVGNAPKSMWTNSIVRHWNRSFVKVNSSNSQHVQHQFTIIAMSTTMDL